MFLEDIVTVFFLSGLGSFLNVYLEYLFVYSKPAFKQSWAEIEDCRSKIESVRAEMAKDAAHTTKYERRIADYEARIKHENQQQASLRMGTMLLTPVILIATMSVINSMYDGYVVARLPFVPFGFFQGITHRGLLGTDFTECSATYLYIVAALTWRPNWQKVFNVAKYQSNSMFFK
eukprot:ANDGO_07976.mRNA.1 Transmembrane and coiled-coil domain-containing protein 1 homolog